MLPSPYFPTIHMVSIREPEAARKMWIQRDDVFSSGLICPPMATTCQEEEVDRREEKGKQRITSSGRQRDPGMMAQAEIGLLEKEDPFLYYARWRSSPVSRHTSLAYLPNNEEGELLNHRQE